MRSSSARHTWRRASRTPQVQLTRVVQQAREVRAAPRQELLPDERVDCAQRRQRALFGAVRTHGRRATPHETASTRDGDACQPPPGAPGTTTHNNIARPHSSHSRVVPQHVEFNHHVILLINQNVTCPSECLWTGVRGGPPPRGRRGGAPRSSPQCRAARATPSPCCVHLMRVGGRAGGRAPCKQRRDDARVKPAGMTLFSSTRC